MKQSILTLATLLEFKRQIDSGVSTPLFTDPVTGDVYAAKSVTEYVAGFFTDADAKNGKILLAANKPNPGIRSLDGNKLAAGVNQLVYEVTILTGVAATADDAGLLATDFTAKGKPYFRNGEVVFSQGTELLKTTGNDINNGYASTGNNDNFKSVSPFVFRGNMAMDVTMTLAGSAVAKDAYRLEYRCIEFVLAEKAV